MGTCSRCGQLVAQDQLVWARDGSLGCLACGGPLPDIDEDVNMADVEAHYARPKLARAAPSIVGILVVIAAFVFVVLLLTAR